MSKNTLLTRLVLCGLVVGSTCLYGLRAEAAALTREEITTDRSAESLGVEGDSFSSQGGDSVYWGGAIYLYNYGKIGKITADFSHNSSTTNGGAISVFGDSQTGDVVGNFEGNKSAAGGAIYNGGTMGNITGSFTENEGTSTGGGIYNVKSGKMGNITGSFKDNEVTGDGGGIANIGTLGTVTGDFTGNTVTSTSESVHSYGGGIYNNGTIDVISGSFDGNRVSVTSKSAYGGGINNDETVTGGIVDTSFTNNSAEGAEGAYGGAIYNCAGATMGPVTVYSRNTGTEENPVLEKGSFTGNTATAKKTAQGGAIFNQGGMGAITGNFTTNSATATDSSSNAQGGAIYNIDGGMGAITGNFATNTVTAKETAQGGAIYNIDGEIDSITGDFRTNSATATDIPGSAKGGAIYNYGGMGAIKGDFEANKAIGYTTYGGAIYNYNTMGDIVGKFTSNTAEGGVDANGGAIFNNGTMNTINGDFAYNKATGESGNGGAIYNNTDKTIASISGSFSNNTATATASKGKAYGGVIFNWGTIGTEGAGIANTSFEYNSVTAESTAYGGAIYNTSVGTLGPLEVRQASGSTPAGSFTGNTATATAKDGLAYGGAITNKGTMSTVTGDFKENTATATASNGIAYGGAIYNASAGTLGAITGDFAGNQATGGGTANGGAIYNASGGATIASLSGSFSNNTAGGTSAINAYGGAIYNDGTIGTEGAGIANTSFEGNSVTATSFAQGGAIYNEGKLGPLEVRQASGSTPAGSFTGNTATAEGENGLAQGGAIYNHQNTIASLTGSFSNNTVTATASNGKAYGGAICNLGLNSMLGAITGDFKENRATAMLEALGGAIYNNQNSRIASISGRFIGNTAGSRDIGAEGTSNIITASTAKGGAIYNSDGNIGTKDEGSGVYTSGIADTSFERNSVTATTLAQGGAIFNYSGSTIGPITAAAPTTDNPTGFIGNTATATASNGKAYGGAIYNTGYSSTLKAITGDFKENRATARLEAMGGAIYNNEQGGIDAIKGNFADNSVTAGSTAQGGAIYNNKNNDKNSTIASISGSFSNNTATATAVDGRAQGGAVNNIGSLGAITGNFADNSVTADDSTGKAYGGAIYNEGTLGPITAATPDSDNPTGFIRNSATATIDCGEAYGGAIYNIGTLDQIIDADFIDNSASGGTSPGTAYGGAIYTNKDLTIKAESRDVLFRGNTVKAVGGEAKGSAVFIGGAGTLTLDAANGRTITFDKDQTVETDAAKGYVSITGAGTVELKDGAKLLVTNTSVAKDANLRVTGAGNKITQLTNAAGATNTFDVTGMTEDGTMLTVPTISFAGAGTINTVNIALAGVKKGGSITLLSSDNDIDYQNSTFQLGGQAVTDGVALTVAEKGEKFVGVSQTKYEAADKTLKLTIMGDPYITAAYTDAEGNSTAMENNTITLTDDAAQFANIYGAYSEKGDASGSTIKLDSALDLGNSSLSGGFSKDGGSVSGNKLEVSAAAAGSKVKSLGGFSEYSFALPNTAATMLSVSGDADISGSTVDVDTSNYAEGTEFTLLEAATGLTAGSMTYKVNGTAITGGESVASYNVSTEQAKGIGEMLTKYSTEEKALKFSVQDNGLLTGKYIAADGKATGEAATLSGKNPTGATRVYAAYSLSDTAGAEGGSLTLDGVSFEGEAPAIAAGNKNAANNTITLTGKNTLGTIDLSGTNNTLNVNSTGNTVTGLTGVGQNYNFALSTDIKPGDVLLQSGEGVDFSGSTINTANAAALELDDGESVALVAAEAAHTYSDSTVFRLDGKEVKPGEGITRAARKENWVTVGEVAYDNTTDPKSLLLTKKTKFIAASYTDAEGEVTAMDKSTATLTADAAKYKAIYGAYSEKGEASGSTLKLGGALDLGSSSLSGGYSADGGSVSGNTLEVSALGAKVGSVANFETMKFVLPADTQKEGSVVLNVTGKADMKATKRVSVDAKDATNIHKGGRVDLIRAGEGVTDYTAKGEAVGLTTKEYKIGLADANTLRLTVEDEKQNSNTKAPVEAVAAAAAFVNQAADFAAGSLSRNMLALGNNGMDVFGAVGGGSSRYETGSHVNARGWNLALGLGRKNVDTQKNATSYGIFFEYGKSNFDTHNDDFRGDGRSNYRGIGLMVNHERNNGAHVEASARVGKVDADWSNPEVGGYDDKATYYGFHAGVGRKLAVGRNAIDVYGRYFYNHTGSMKGNIAGYDYDFDAVNSSRLRIGARLEFNSEFGNRNSELTPSPQPSALRPYVGLAWEHEFSGDANATVLGLGRVDAPSLKGNSGILELGCRWKAGRWDLNLGVEGYTGVRKGVSGGIKFNYNF